MEEEVLIVSSSIDGSIVRWNLQTGTEYLRYKSCASTPHGLTCISNFLVASSQIRDSKASSGSIFYWSWSKPQVEVKSFIEEPLKPIATNDEGTYLVGGGLSGNIYLWEVVSGRLRRKWRAHYRAVTCLVFNVDNSLLVSGSEDGSVRVWSLCRIFDNYQCEHASHLYQFNFSEHTLSVTDIVASFSTDDNFIISASEDHTCKVWSLSQGKLLRSIAFPSVIDAIALGHGDLYAGSRDGQIYIAALRADSSSIETQWPYILDSLSGNGKAISCLAYSLHGDLLLAGSEDGNVRVWDPTTRNIVRIFKYGKGPVNNIYVVKPVSSQNPQALPNAQTSSIKQRLEPLQKYVNLTDEKMGVDPVVHLRGACNNFPDFISCSQLIIKRIKEFQPQDSSGAVEVEVERLKNENKESNQRNQKWKKMSQEVLEFCVNEVLDMDNMESPSNP